MVMKIMVTDMETANESPAMPVLASGAVYELSACSVMTEGVNGKRYGIKCPLAELCSACLVCYLLFWVCLQSLTHSLAFLGEGHCWIIH